MSGYKLRAVQIVPDKRAVVMADRSRSIIQRCKQICLDIAYFRRCPGEGVKHILDMLRGQFHHPGLDYLCGHLLSVDAYIPGCTGTLRHKLHQLIQFLLRTADLLPICIALRKLVILDVLLDLLPVQSKKLR